MGNAGDSRRAGQVVLALALMGVLLFVGFASAQRGDDGWVNLLQGTDLTKNWTTTGNWTLGPDGVVALVPRPGEKGWTRYDAYLWSKKEYTDFEAEFEYKVEKGGNSGFYFRVADVKDPVKKGLEVQIFDSAGKAKDAKLTDHDAGGIIPGFPPTRRNSNPTGQWDKMNVLNKANKATIRVNGEIVNEVDLGSAKIKDRPPVGFVGFQDHGLPLWLRNIRIREIK